MKKKAAKPAKPAKPASPAKRAKGDTFTHNGSSWFVAHVSKSGELALVPLVPPC